MVTLTKKTQTAYTNASDIVGEKANQDFVQARNEKIHEMVQSGKTDNSQTKMVSDTVVERQWLDQAAAQEYSDFMNQIATQYNVSLVGITITDI